MAFVTADRVLDSSTSTGTGPFVVSGTPAAGYQTFSSVMSVGDTCYYSIQGQTTSEWEVGLGTYSSANTLTRTTIYSSSNAGSAVTFSAGTKNVFLTMAASRSPQLNASGNITALGTPVSATLTNATGLPLTTGVTGVLPPANGGALAWQSVQTSNFAAVAGNAYPVNTTSGAVTVTLPASPSAGQIVQLTDYAGTWATNNLLIAPNGSKINGVSVQFSAIFNRESIAFVYIDSVQGWLPYSGINASSFSQYTASYLVVAGGGGGARGGGGGAGGLLTGSATLSSGTAYTITVGAGGAGSTPTSTQASNGNASSALGFTASGGGGGGGFSTTGLNQGRSGGSGGGGGGADGGQTQGIGGSGTSGQGFSGGNGSTVNTTNAGGGGGGSSAVGANASSGTSGAGGAGTSSSITGSAVTYAGGGGGSGATAAGAGGAGGGGNGSTYAVNSGSAGTANTGGGGGANNGTAAFAGGSGVVILSVPTALYTGTTTGSPTVTTSGSNTILKFTASGSYTA